MPYQELTRRALLFGAAGASLSGCIPAGALNVGTATGRQQVQLPPHLRRKQVPYDGTEPAGSIVVHTADRYLYHVEAGGRAMRYGIGVGQEGLTLKGQANIGRKEEWPAWTPTANMIRRKPHLAQYAGGVPGGPNNPLGARALYLYRGGQDTMFRLHGTNEPSSIGQAVSSGCVRLLNDDIVHLYDRVAVGATVTVL